MALACMTWALLTVPGVAWAEGAIDDAAHMFSPGAQQTANARIEKIKADTGVVVHVVTVTRLSGGSVADAAALVFAQQKMQGILLYVTKDDQQLAVKVDGPTQAAIPIPEQVAIRDAMIVGFQRGDFDNGLLTALDRIGLDVQQLRVGRGSAANATATAPKQASKGSTWNWTSVPVVGLVVLLLGLLWVRRRSRGATATFKAPATGPSSSTSPAAAREAGMDESRSQTASDVETRDAPVAPTGSTGGVSSREPLAQPYADSHGSEKERREDVVDSRRGRG